MRKKVTIVGAGNVGATAAHWIASKELADVVLIDIIEGVPQGKALDLLEAMPIEKRDCTSSAANDYADTANSDIVVITAGIPRKPGMSRDDLLNTNYKIMSDVVGEVVEHSPELHPHHRLQPARRHGAGRLQASRLPPRARHRHGRRARLRPLPHLHRRRSSTSASKTSPPSSSAATATPWCRCRATPPSPASRSPSSSTPTASKSSSSAPATAAPKSSSTSRPAAPTTHPPPPPSRWSKPSSRTRRRSCPAPPTCKVSTASGLYVGVPCKLGAKGLEQIIEIKLTPEENAALNKSAAAVKELCAVIGV